MADKKIEIQITADSQQARKGLQEVGQAVESLAPAHQKAGAAAEDGGRRTAQATQQAAGGVGALGQAARQAGAQTQASFNNAAASANSLGSVWSKVKEGLANFTPGVVLGNLITSLIGRLGEMGRAFIAANVQADGLRRAFTAIYKDASVAEGQIAFLRQTSTKAGISFAALADSFKSFSAATAKANIPLQVSNDLFASVTQASATLGLSGERTSLVLQALGQMASKSVVSMEELRQQLGESLPGALALAANGLGITEQQLIKLVESGGLAARDLFPALAQSLKTLQGENDGLQGSWERLKTAVNGAVVALGDGGGMAIMTVAVKALAAALAIVVIPLQGMFEGLMGVVRSAGAAGAAIGVLLDKSTTWEQKAAGLREVGAALKESFDQADVRMQATAGAFVAVVAGADRTAAGMQAAAGAANASTAVFAQYAQQWIGIGQSLREAAAEQDKVADNSAKLAAAAKVEGAAVVALVALRGNARDSADAEAAAAQRTAEALAAVAVARANQLAIVQAELTAKQAMVAGNADEEKARAQELKDLADKVEKLKAESEAATQAAKAAKNGAVASQAAAEAMRDNAYQVQNLTRELEASTATVVEYERLQLQGKKTAEDVAEAKRQQALAESRLNDALGDNVDRLRAAAIARNADAQASISLLETQKMLAGQAGELARMMGDESKARQMRIEQLKIDIQITLAKAEAMRAEADGSILVAKATMEELRVKGQLTPLKEAELQATMKIAEARIKEANAIGQSTKLTQQAIENLKRFGSEAGKAGNAGHGAGERAAAGWQKASAAIGQASQAAAEYQKQVATKYGAAGKSPSLSTIDRDAPIASQGVWNRSAIIDYLTQAGMDELLAERLAKQFHNADGSVDYEATAAQKNWGGKFATLSEALGKMVDYYKHDSTGKHEAQQMLEYERTNVGLNKPADAPSRSVPPAGRERDQERGRDRERSSSGASASGMSAGPTYISNYTLPGVGRAKYTYKSPQEQRQGDDFIARLAAAKGVSQ